MSEGANSVPQICENLITTLKEEVDPEELPPRTISHTTRRSRFGTGNVPLSPYILIDGRKLRSSLALSKKKTPRRVSFPTSDNHLITGYLEPANPWKLAKNVCREDLISAYKESCIKHNSDPLESVISQLESVDTSEVRNEELNLKGETLDVNHAEPLEEVFKRIQFDRVDLQATSLDDESSVILFDMLEYYESVKHLNISSNPGIAIHGWQACANMIRKTQCLEQLEAKDLILNEQYMNILSRALRLVCHLHVLKLENCGLSGRSIITLVSALKINTGIRELYLADNGLDLYDAIQLGSLLRLNNHIQLLDVSNNLIQDDGVRDILEGLINQINEDKDGKGLNILILWNNQLTKKSAPYFARIIAFSKTLETLNIGKNMLTDELLFIIKDALKKNRVLQQLGIQSTDITCDGIVTLCEIIEMNQVLQRIDLRNNNIQLTGMKALSSAMKKSRSITKLDLDDKPDTKIDDLTQTLHHYTQLVAEIRNSCLENEQNRKLEENNEGFENSYCSKLNSTTSRKISLTCQTLPCSLPSTNLIQKDDTGQSMLEPKRINGGRLRSPAPSPASSPIASPILSPSRSRFVVSRVPETLRSTESSVSPSSVVPSSLGSSPTCVTSASRSSRFRVSVVESANIVSLPKPVITTTEAGIPIDSKSKGRVVKSTNLDDSGNVFTSELDKTVENTQSTSKDVPRVLLNEVEDVCVTRIHECLKIEELDANKCLVNAASKIQCNDNISTVSFGGKNDVVQDNQIISETKSVEDVKNSSSKYIKEIKTSDNTNITETGNSSTCPTINDKSTNVTRDQGVTNRVTCTNESIGLQPQTKHDPIQKSTSNLGKLLSLFQHSSCFFSDPASVNQLKSKNTLQGSINSMMTLGDKFHYYIKDKKDRIYNRETEESSISLKSKSKFFNVSQLPSLQSLANIIPSFRFETNLNVSEQSNKSYCPKQGNLLLERDTDDESTDIEKKNVHCSRESKKLSVCLKGQNINVPTSANQSLSEDIQSKLPAGITNKDVVLTANCIVSNIIDTCSKIVIDNLLMHVSSSNTAVPVPKLIGIPEYSALRAAISDIQKEDIPEILGKVNPILIKGTDDKTSTDSINFTSDSNSLSCSLMYNVSKEMHTLHMPDKMHNLVILKLSTKDNNPSNTEFNINSIQSDKSCFLCKGKCVCNVSNKSLNCYSNTLKVNVKTNCLNNEVTKMYSIDSDSDKNVFISVCNMPSNEVEKVNVNSSMKWNSTVVNDVPKAKISNVNCTCKESNFELREDSLELCTLESSENVSQSSDRKAQILFLTRGNKYSKTRDIEETDVNNSAVEPCLKSSSRNMNIVMYIPRMYTCMTNLNTFALRNLIRHVADINVDDTPVKGVSLEITSNNWSDNVPSIRTLLWNMSQTSNLSLNAITEKLADNSNQDSFISSDVVVGKSFCKGEHIDVSEPLGSVSQCSALPLMGDPSGYSREDMTNLKVRHYLESSSAKSISVYHNSGSNIDQHSKCTNSDDICERTDEYLNAKKCAVATTMCSTIGVNTGGNTTIDVTSEQNSSITESSTVIGATSTK